MRLVRTCWDVRDSEPLNARPLRPRKAHPWIHKTPNTLQASTKNSWCPGVISRLMPRRRGVPRARRLVVGRQVGSLHPGRVDVSLRRKSPDARAPDLNPLSHTSQRGQVQPEVPPEGAACQPQNGLRLGWVAQCQRWDSRSCSWRQFERDRERERDIYIYIYVYIYIYMGCRLSPPPCIFDVSI